MSKIILIILSAIVFNISVLYSQNDSKAKEILDQMSKKAKSYSSVKISFTYSIENKEKKTQEKQSGKAVVKGPKYRLSISGQEVISDSLNIWTYLKDANEVQITKAEYNDESITPVNIFTIYQKGYKYKYIEEQNLNNKTHHVIDLFPETSRNFFRVRLFIDKVSLQINKAEVSDKKGNLYTYTRSEFLPNVTIHASTFSFKKEDYPGIEVIDLRE
jgi:outer membrane lipoprotein-sorting protein